MNILISTTRMWNPGDEVIYLGVKHLLNQRFGRFTSVLWNRHPGIKPMRGNYDNSFDGSRHSITPFDYYVSAGGPEWLGPRVSEVYSCLLKAETSCIHLGIGTGKADVKLDKDAYSVFSKSSSLVTCRDQTTFNSLEGIVAADKLHLLPCPSLFSFIDRFKARETNVVKKVGLNYQGAKMLFNNVGDEAYRRCMQAYEKVSKEFEFTVICNYVDDYNEAVQIFDPSLVRFSADISDFYEFFDEVDVVLGTRIHGCMGAISSGTPGYILDSEKDLRRRGVREVMEILDPAPMNGDELVALLKKTNPAELSKRNFAYAEKIKAKYLELLETCPRASVISDSAFSCNVSVGLADTARGKYMGEHASRAVEKAELLVEKVRRRLL